MKVQEDYRTQIERLTKECQLSQRKVTDLFLEKKEKKEHYENELSRLKTEIGR